MKTIFKYTLEPKEQQSIEVPDGAEFLTVQIQHDVICVWAIVDPSKKKTTELFFIVGTGHPLPKQPNYLQYVGTVQELGGSLVWHLFRAVK